MKIMRLQAPQKPPESILGEQGQNYAGKRPKAEERANRAFTACFRFRYSSIICATTTRFCGQS